MNRDSVTDYKRTGLAPTFKILVLPVDGRDIKPALDNILLRHPDATVVVMPKSESKTPTGTTKKFGKGERHVPHHSTKAKRYYPAEDETQPKQVGLLLTGSLKKLESLA